ncbi:MAG: type II and III secretion system protein family protein [Methylobacteriaceae bacterium]|nr:type II and III secretion system protein family protein [Methylobacteriaceae bacterium]
MVFAVGGTLISAASLEPVRAEQAGIESAQQALLARRFTMGVGRSIIVDLPRDATEIVVANPAVANAVVRSPRKIFVLATGAGQTTIFALDQQGRQIANIELTIGRDVGELEQILKTALPKSAIVPRTINDTIILTGFVDSAGEAQQAVDIARGFASKLSSAAAPGAAAGAKVADDGSVVNSLVIRGRDQVSLKVTIAEVQRQVLKQLGVATNTVAGEKQVAGVWGSFTQDNPLSLNGQLSKSAVQFLGPNNTSVTLNAFERYGVSRVLAEPTVTAVSGENAKFMVGGEVPVPASSSCTAIGTTTQALCTPSIAYKPIGVELNFTPVVLSEGRILLRIATEVTEVDQQNSFTYAGVTVPGFRTRKHETSIELPSGGSIATAGLLEQNARNSINGLPAVMNLPILGALFRSRDYQRLETELLIVVTPYIVRPVSPNEIAKPDDGFADASDPQGWLLGRVNRLYSSRNNPEAVQNYKGRFGFITD